MNTPVPFPSPQSELKLARPSADKWAATLAEERRRLCEDQEALRERESNLREYEERLRNWQNQLDAGRHGVIPAAKGMRVSLPGLSYAPAASTLIGDENALQVAWEKLHRAREIMEAEQNHLRDDRIVVREKEKALAQREEAVAARESAVAERERLIAEAALPEVPGRSDAAASAEQGESAVARLTKAPFHLARSVFGGKR